MRLPSLSCSMAGMSVNAHPAVETLFPCRPAGIAQDLSRTYYVEHPQLNIFKKLPMEAYSWCTGNDLKGISIHLHRYATYHSAKSVRIESPYTAVARTRFVQPGKIEIDANERVVIGSAKAAFSFAPPSILSLTICRCIHIDRIPLSHSRVSVK